MNLSYDYALIRVQAPTRSGRNKVVKPRGRPPGKRALTTAKNRGPKPGYSKEKAERKRSSQAASRKSDTAKSRERPRRRNEETNDNPDEISAPQPKNQKYVQLAPRTRRIAQEKIDTWPQVSAQVLDQIIGVLRDAKKDIVNTQRDERRATVADDTLGALVRVLERQLSASRIPPQAKDIHFNIDKLTERYAQLFREVTRERHSKQLLKEQVKVAQHLLKKDEENLKQLKKNAKDWKTEWKHQEKHGRVRTSLFWSGLSMRLTCCSSIRCCRTWKVLRSMVTGLTTLV